MSKIALKSGATLQHGQLIVPGAKPNSLDKNSPLHPRRTGKQKNFQVADREHGFDKHDLALKIPGASQGKRHHPDASMGHGVPVHPGMLHVNQGVVTAGISKTQKYFDDEPNSKLITRDHAAEAAEASPPMQYGYHQTPGVHGLTGSLPTKIIK